MACDNSIELIVFFPNSVLVYGNSYSVFHGVTILYLVVKVIMNYLNIPINSYSILIRNDC